MNKQKAEHNLEKLEGEGARGGRAFSEGSEARPNLVGRREQGRGAARNPGIQHADATGAGVEGA